MAISVDTASESTALAARLGLSFPLLVDTGMAGIRAYGVADEANEIAWPAVFVVGADGKVAWRALSETYKKRPAAEELLDVLDAQSRAAAETGR